MTRMMYKKQFIQLINQFLHKAIQPEQFCTEYTQLWMAHRDFIDAKREAWPEPYDQQLLQKLHDGLITQEVFSQKWSALWGNAEDEPFNDIIDALHSACDVFDPNPEFDWELDEEAFFREVVDIVEPLGDVIVDSPIDVDLSRRHAELQPVFA
ncbi:MAG: hypothetical protein AAF639_26705 [Chloroflexota bacterium]